MQRHRGGRLSSRSEAGCRKRRALIRRAAAEALFTLRAFAMLLTQLRRGDVVLTVTAPFMLPYAVVAAARLKGARSVLIMHDLYPDVLVMAGLLKPASLLTLGHPHGANAMMFRMLDVVVTIGRDTERLLLRYRGMTRDKIRFIPNWATLAPAVRPIGSDNPYRRPCMPRASWSAFPAISVLPTIPSSCSRRRDCCGTRATFISCCRAGGLASSD